MTAGPAKVHVTGASGSGTTTLGRSLADRLGCPHLDTDDVFWCPSEPPYQAVRPRAERLQLLAAPLDETPGWVLSGSLCGWGDPLATRFDLVVFLLAPTPVRVERLRAREHARFGAPALAPGGAMHEQHAAFLIWAAGYDGGTASRNRAEHESWLASLPCPVLRLDGLSPTVEQVGLVMSWLSGDTDRR